MRGAAALNLGRALTLTRALPQPPFLNAAVRGTTQLPPHELLRQLKAIEAELGRTVGGQARPTLLAGCLSGVQP